MYAPGPVEEEEKEKEEEKKKEKKKEEEEEENNDDDDDDDDDDDVRNWYSSPDSIACIFPFLTDVHWPNALPLLR